MSSKGGKQSTKKTKPQIARRKNTGKADEKVETFERDGRFGQRIPIQLLVDYQCDGNYLFDFCKDLGAGGIFIETTTPLTHGSTVDLIFTLPDSKETLETKGKVIWVQTAVPGKDLTPGMGVQFEGFSPKQRKLLEEFVSRYHGESLAPMEKTEPSDSKTA